MLAGLEDPDAVIQAVPSLLSPLELHRALSNLAAWFPSQAALAVLATNPTLLLNIEEADLDADPTCVGGGVGGTLSHWLHAWRCCGVQHAVAARACAPRLHVPARLPAASTAGQRQHRLHHQLQRQQRVQRRRARARMHSLRAHKCVFCSHARTLHQCALPDAAPCLMLRCRYGEITTAG